MGIFPIVTNQKCYFFTPGETNTCACIKDECANCEGCKFFKHKDDRVNNTRMKDYIAWLELRLPYKQIDLPTPN